MLKQYMNIYVAKCQGYTLEGEECFPLEEIDEKLADMNIFLSLYTETIGLDHHNNKNQGLSLLLRVPLYFLIK